jgi:arylsulfatase A-like enzyme
MTTTHRLLLLIALLVFSASTAVTNSEARPLNIVLILTDNQGAWTLGCYGNPDIQTPNIDRLAREGMLFNQCFSSNAVCSPTRATLLTGLIPSQHGVHSYLPAGGAQVGPHAYSTIAEFRTLPKILSEAGYTCGLAGKWHLGNNLKPQEGFTSWVTMPHGHTVTFYDADVIDDGKVRKEPEYLTDFWTDRGVKFIKENKDKPFFLYLAYNGPYGLGPSMLEQARNRHAEYYADKELKSFPREKMNPWLASGKNLLNNVKAMRRYAAEISGVDDGVGRIMAALKANKLDDNTLVIFTADQGLAGGQNGFWGMGDHTRPLTAFDWTTHVPLIYRHPGHIGAGQRSDILVSNYDFLPTVLDYIGLKEKIPQKPRLPGHSYSNTLNGKRQAWNNTVFFEYENTRAIRTRDRKYVGRFPDGPNELYDLKSDPDERHNLIDQRVHAAEQKSLRERLDQFFATYADPQYDLSRGGRSKANRRIK